MKLEKIKYAVVVPKGYSIALLVEVSWETEKSFGDRGTTIKFIRSTQSTGEMYKKDECAFKMFDSYDDAIKFINTLRANEKSIDAAERNLRIARQELYNLVKNK